MSEAERFQDEREAGWVRTAFERMNEPPIARNFALYEMLGTIPGFRVRDRAALKGRFIDTLKETEAGSGVWVADSEPDIHDDHSFRVMLALGKDPIGRTVTKWNRCNYVAFSYTHQLPGGWVFSKDVAFQYGMISGRLEKIAAWQGWERDGVRDVSHMLEILPTGDVCIDGNPVAGAARTYEDVALMMRHMNSRTPLPIGV